MAFAPEVQAAPPYTDLPYERSGTKLRTRAASWARWEAGFGDLAAKVAANHQALSGMRGISVAFGWAEEDTWMLAVCLYFSDLLSDNRIPHRFVSLEGGHANHLAERVHGARLSFFLETLDFGH